MLADGPVQVLYYLAALSADVKLVLLDPAGPAEALGGALRAAGARTLITGDQATSYSKATQLLAFSVIDRLVIVPLRSQVSTLSAMGLMLGAGERLARVSAATLGAAVHEADLLRDPGATTLAGGPAGTASSAFGTRDLHQLLAALPELAQGSERFVAGVPLSDPLALRLVSGLALAQAAEIVIPDKLKPADIARALSGQGPSVLITSPARLGRLLAEPGMGPRVWKDLRLTVTLGGEPSAQLLLAYAKATAAPLRAIFSAGGAAAAIGAVGPDASPGVYHPLGETRFVVRDLAEPSREVPRGERGALHVAGPQFTPADGPGEAFVPTGDVGVIDAAGQVVLIDRIGELVVAQGYMIYPRRIEAAMRDHPGVAEGAVVGVSDGKRGMAPKAFVILKPHAAVTERDLMKHLCERISRIELPADINVCSSLPRDAFGEVDRRALREGLG